MHVGGAKASDCVSHEILLNKLNLYGIQLIAAEWFRSYLTGRKQKVIIRSSSYTQIFFSNCGTIKHGVHQGSILGPLFFIMYTNELPPTINTLANPIIFADDTSVIISSKISMISIEYQA
jgi:hypothetical protein